MSEAAYETSEDVVAPRRGPLANVRLLDPEDPNSDYLPPDDWRPTAEKPFPPSRCVVRTKTPTEGKNAGRGRCETWAMQGTTVCAAHGSAKQLRASARERVAAAREELVRAAKPAARRLASLVESEDETVALRASTAILDRVGLGASSSVEISGEVEIISAGDALAQRLAVIAERLNAPPPQAAQAPAITTLPPRELRAEGEIIDGEVVEDASD